ncbi:MlaD family protein [Roseibium polysiphoniae]|uniref:MCE family protein n=1 Tax=Roseibium polysiphoniae TaxID=2571221 RepID=A0ABR9C926_9HYPH|nr:MlaD family protein [Roseibium polysiphoniae]MBD8876417.1 MCE family protein [Roseibium polysiphoniae]
METRANYIIIGAFMMATLVSAFGFVYWLAATAESRENVFLKIVFPAPVTGLPVGGQVLFNGIKVGDVSSLDFDPDNPKVVIATVRVKPTTPLRDDTVATLNFTGLTGVAYVDLNGGSLDAPLLLHPGSDEVPTIKAERSLFDDIVGGARDVLTKAESTMSTIDELLQENGPAIGKTVQNIETFSGALASNSDGISDFMASMASVSDAVSKLSTRMEGLVVEGERILAAVPSDKVTAIVTDLEKFSASLGQAGDGIDSIMNDAQSAMSEVQTFTAGLNSGLSDVQKLVQAIDPADVDKVAKGAAALGEMLEKRTPQLDAVIVASTTTMENLAQVSDTIREHDADIGSVLTSSRDVMGKVVTLMARGVEIAAAVDPATVASVVASVDTLTRDLNTSLAKVDAIVAKVDPEKVGSAVDNASSIVANIKAQENQINEIIAATNSTIQNFEQVSATVRDEDDRIIALVDDVRVAAEQFTQTLKGADGILRAVDPQKVSSIVGSVETVTGGLSGQKESIDQMIVSARTAAQNVEKMTADLQKRTPDVDQIISDAKEMTATLNATSVRVQSIVDQVGTMVEGDGEGLIVEATKAATSIRKVASAFESRADSIAGGLSKFANQGSSDFAAAMSQINRTLVSIQRAVENFDRSPNRIIFGGDEVPTYTGGRRR